MVRPTLALLALSTASHLQAMQLTLNVTNATCTYASGAIEVQLSGGVPPYSFQWDDGPTYAHRTGLLPGIYSLTVTDANSDQVTEQAEVFSTTYDVTTTQLYPYCVLGGQLWPMTLVPAEAVGPWYFDGIMLQQAPGSVVSGTDTIYAYYPPTQYYSYSIMDGNGCTGTLTGTRGQQVTAWPSFTVTGVEPSCSLIGTGAVHIQSTGPAPDQSFAHLRFINTLGQIQPFYGQVDAYTYTADVTGLPSGTYGILWSLGITMEALDPGTCDVDTVWVTVPDLGPVCGRLQGSAWYDVDGDCVQDVTETGIPYSPLIIQPGNVVLHTGSHGGFETPLLNGAYTLEQADPTLVPICPAVQPVPFTISTNTVTLALADGSMQPLDLRATLSTGTARPGFNVSVFAAAWNMSPQVSGPVTMTVTLDPQLSYVSATSVPTDIAGNTITWQFPALTSFGERSFTITTHLDPGTPLGTQLANTLVVSNTLPDADPANDTWTGHRIVQGSYDPNEKHVRTSSGISDAEFVIGEDQYLDYTIDFQNTGTDTAFTVTVIDTLPPTLDLLTYQQGATSHPMEVAFRAGGVVQWTFPHILLPDSNTNEAASHGLVSFRIRAAQPVLPGTVISNHADIVFDFNTAVRTNDAVLTATQGTGVPHTTSALCRLVRSGDRLLVSAMDGALAINSMRLFTLDGRSVSDDGAFILDHNGRALDIGALATGCYVISVTARDGRTWQQRFVH